MSDPILDHLTDAQREAVTHVNGPMLVVAGAGSGKTRVVTRRIAYLIRQGVRPSQILAMTFTNKAAGEMKQRVETLTGALPRWVGTFHSLCARFLRFDLDKLNEGRGGNFSIYDQTDQQGLVKQCLKDLSIDDKRFKPAMLLNRISLAKCDGVSPDDFADGSWDADTIARVYGLYEQKLREMNALDFDDLLLLTVRMLKNVPGLKEYYRQRFPYLLIDEYQDTNRVQYNLMRLLTGEAENVHATGDPDQSIYSWRGADYRNIMDFQSDFPGAKIVRLEQNYRSTKTILAAANAVIRNNADRIEKELFTENEDGEPVAIASLPSDREEARYVADTVSELRAGGGLLRDMAVFYRTNAQSRPFEEALMRAGVAYQVIGGVRFYERKEIKDFLAHLKMIVNPRDQISLARVIGARATGVGPKTMEKVLAQASARSEDVFAFLAHPDFASRYDGKPPKKLQVFADWCRRLAEIPKTPVGDCVKALLDATGLVLEIELKSDRDPAARDRIENLEQFVNRAYEFQEEHPDADLAAFLEDVALVADIDSFDPGADVLSLMTLHSAKGLEFPVVFLVGLEEGILPHQNSHTPFQKQEERRLFYVGLTRAQQRAYIAYASTRMLWGQIQVSSPSTFLGEIPPELTECIQLADPFNDFAAPGGGKEKRDWDDLDDFCDDGFGDEFLDDPFPDEFGPNLSTGDHVEHDTFGRGKVLSVSKNKAVIQFFVGGTKMLHLDAAPLRKV